MGKFFGPIVQQGYVFLDIYLVIRHCLKTALINGNHLRLEGGPVSSHFDSDFTIRAVH